MSQEEFNSREFKRLVKAAEDFLKEEIEKLKEEKKDLEKMAMNLREKLSTMTDIIVGKEEECETTIEDRAEMLESEFTQEIVERESEGDEELDESPKEASSNDEQNSVQQMIDSIEIQEPPVTPDELGLEIIEPDEESEIVDECGTPEDNEGSLDTKEKEQEENKDKE